MTARLVGVAAIFAIAALYFVYSGFAMTTSVEVDGQTIANFELMHAQSLNITLGIACAIIAALFAVGASIVGAIRPDE